MVHSYTWYCLLNLLWWFESLAYSSLGHRGRNGIVVGFTTTFVPVHSMPTCITTKAVSSKPAHVKVYSVQQYVINVCQWLAAGWCFSLGTPVSSTNKTDCRDIAEILLKVVLNTIIQTKIVHECPFESSELHENDRLMYIISFGYVFYLFACVYD